jgi:peptidoglycan/xylan/chitin deacetylase (PgdA/CDA1 family)
VRPDLWPFVVGGLAANHALFIGASLWPTSRLLGPNLVRLPARAARRSEVAITFDDGPDPDVTPRVLDLLDAAGAKGTFFCIADRATAWPALVRDIVQRGHSVENHSKRHSTSFGWYGLRAFCRELGEAQMMLAEITGRAPRFFRAPFGMRNPLLDPALVRSGLRLVSWTRRGFDAVDQRAERVVRRLCNGLVAGDILLLHDGVASRARNGEPTVLAALPALLREVDARGLKAVTVAAGCGDGPAG